MRPPSPRCLPNTVALYRFTPSRSPELGVSANPYVLIALSVPCSVQPEQPDRIFDEGTIKIAQKGQGSILFTLANDHALTLNDKAVWVDRNAVSHDLYIKGGADQAGRGAMVEYSYEEQPV